MHLCDRTSKGFSVSHRRIESIQRFINEEETSSRSLKNAVLNLTKTLFLLALNCYRSQGLFIVSSELCVFAVILALALITGNFVFLDSDEDIYLLYVVGDPLFHILVLIISQKKTCVYIPLPPLAVLSLAPVLLLSQM